MEFLMILIFLILISVLLYLSLVRTQYYEKSIYEKIEA